MEPKYQRLENESIEDIHQARERTLSKCYSSSYLLCVLFLFLIASLELNIALTFGHVSTSALSSYANLSQDKLAAFPSDDNPWMSDEYDLWADPNLRLDAGVVALEDSWTAARNLPEAQRWPWDKSKGIYIVNGYHNLHCILLLRRSIQLAFSGGTQLSSEHHLLHCLNILREDVMCSADDTLRYTGRVNDQANATIPHSGYGQERLCRDWSKLQQWAVQNSACYQAGTNTSDTQMPESERYKHCPDGSSPWLAA